MMTRAHFAIRVSSENVSAHRNDFHRIVVFNAGRGVLKSNHNFRRMPGLIGGVDGTQGM